MINVLKSRNKYYYFIILFLLNILLTKEEYKTFKINISIKENELDNLSINDDSSTDEDRGCEKWIPSLFNPVLLVPGEFVIRGLDDLENEFEIYSAYLFGEIKVHLYKLELFSKKYNLILAKNFVKRLVKDCYFGLSYSIANYIELNENQINLKSLMENNKIDNEIFSFDKWTIKESSIESNFYFGDAHDNFINNRGIIGKCYANIEDIYWGCPFTKISLNNNITELKRDNENDEKKYYKIFFSSESHNIIFPSSFKKKFLDLSNNNCFENSETKEISCQNLFNSEYYIPLKLINDNMTITTEIDNIYTFNRTKEDKKYNTRIIFEEVDYFILPLIMFKKFHIQFDAKNKIISFYTTNSSILELKKEEENNSNNEDKKEEQPSSNAGIIVLVIFIVLLILVLLFGIIWFIRKRRGSGDKNINKYNKFEDDENFQDMNEKRVF